MVRIDKLEGNGKVITNKVSVEQLKEALQLSKAAAKAQYEEPYEGKWLKHAFAKLRYLELLDEVRNREKILKYEELGDDNEAQHMVEIDGKAYCFMDQNFGCWCNGNFYFSEFKKSLNWEFDKDYIWV